MSAVQPFVRLSDPFDADRPLWFGKANPVLGVALKPNGYGLVAAAVNEQVARQAAISERKAAAKALRNAAKKWPTGRGKFKSGEFGLWLEAEAAAIEKGGAS